MPNRLMYPKALVILAVTLYYYWKASSTWQHGALPPKTGRVPRIFHDVLDGKARYVSPAAILSIAYILSASAHNVRSTNICPLMVFSANAVPWLQLIAVALDAWTFSATEFLAETAYKASLAPASIGYTLLVRFRLFSQL